MTDDIAVVDIAAAHHPQWVHRTHVDLLAVADEMLHDTNPPDGLPYESTNIHLRSVASLSYLVGLLPWRRKTDCFHHRYLVLLLLLLRGWQ